MSRHRPNSSATCRPPCAGWSFIEVMAAMAIIAILLAIAVPSYRQYMQRGHRAEAVNTLLQAAGCQERIRAATGYYDTTRCISQPPGGRYRITLEPEGVTASLVFEAIATPARPTAQDRCGELSIDQSGRRSIGGAAPGLGDCWGGR
jgi:type IV pilus assembly protein PilE